VTFTQCGVAKPIQYRTQGFWYGLGGDDGITLDQHAFRLRGAFPPDTTWQWLVQCSKRTTTQDTPDCQNDPGLNTSGRFHVKSSDGKGFLYSGGFLRIAANGKYLTLNNNSKFFWLGDSAWNANILMSLADWKTYIDNRAQNPQGPLTQFTVVQMSTAPVAAGGMDTNTKPPFDPIAGCSPGNGPGSCYRLNPLFWKGVDDKIDYANQQGIAVLFAGFIEPLSKSTVGGYSAVLTNPDEAKIFAQSIAARLYGNFVVFSPGFDHTLPDNSGIIDAVGAAIGDNTSGVTSRHLVTNHSASGSPVTDYTHYLQGESWMDFELFQSGTPGNSQDSELSNLTDRALSMPSKLSAAKPTMPVINGESVYPGQDKPPYTFLVNHTPYRARQTAYLSMLSGAVGYSMGTCGVVDWGKGGGLAACPTPLNWQLPSTDPFNTAADMRILRFIFQSISWERLLPQPTRILNQTGDPATRMALAYDGRSAMLAYLPQENSSIQIDFTKGRPVPGLASATSWSASGWVQTWTSPRTKQTATALPPTNVRTGVFEFHAPAQPGQCDGRCDANDWVLKITKGKVQSGTSQTQIAAVNGPSLVAANELRVLEQTLDTSSGQVLGQTEIGGNGLTSPGQPSIATELSGNSMVVWQADTDTSTTISGRVLDSGGQPLTPEITIASGITARPGHPSVATLSNGDFLVVWAGSEANRYGPWIRAQRFNHLGTPLTSPIMVVSCDYVPGDFPQATPVGAGYAIAWEMSGNAGIYVQQVDGAGTRSEARVAQSPGATLILESLDTDGTQPLVSYGLYADDGTVMGGDTVFAAATPLSCSSPPLAAADTFSTYQDIPITIGLQELLSNDAPGVTFDHSDPRCVLTPGPSGCTYTPSAGYTGTDTFPYTVRDAQNNLGSANISIQVAPIELHATFTVTCANRTCTTHPTSWGTLPVTRWLWNWSDGSPTVEPTVPYRWVDQTYTYGQSGRYTITHTVYDSAGHSNSLQLAVLADTPPVAANDTASTDRDVPVTIDILANDSDADNDPLTFSVNLSTYPGSSYQAVQVGSRWALKVTPPDSFVGTMTFTYTSCDNWGMCAPPATVTLTVKQWTVVVDALGEQFYGAQNGSIRIPIATLLANDFSDLTPLSIPRLASTLRPSTPPATRCSATRFPTRLDTATRRP